MVEQRFSEYGAGVIPGKTYKVLIRWRAENLTGPLSAGQPYGMAVKFTGTSYKPVVVAHEAGDSNWHVSTGTFVADTDFIGSGSSHNVAIMIDNVTGGTAYVDEITIHEVLADGTLGPNIVFMPKFNAYMEFDPRRSFGIDYILDQAAARNVTFKLVIEEKQEWLINHWDGDGLPRTTASGFNNMGESPNYALHQFFWRNLMAQFGASRAVQSWELCNEYTPNDVKHMELTAKLADAAHADGNPHMASTSTWAGYSTSSWNDPSAASIDYTDFHCYVDGTGWIDPKTDLARDSARFYDEYSRGAIAQNYGKQCIWGEMGIDGPEAANIGNDTAGIFLHKIIWAQSNGTGVIPMYWWTDGIFGNNLHYKYGDWKDFMTGVPLTNGNYVDAVATSSNTNVRVMGQKDMTNRQAYLWIDNKTHTWWNVVNSPTSVSNQSSTITIALGQANAQYTVTWWNTYTGSVSSTQTLTANSSGVLSLSVSGLANDKAVKITPVGTTYGASMAAPSMLLTTSTGDSTEMTTQTRIDPQPGKKLGKFKMSGELFSRASLNRQNASWLQSWSDDELIGTVKEDESVLLGVLA